MYSIGIVLLLMGLNTQALFVIAFGVGLFGPQVDFKDRKLLIFTNGLLGLIAATYFILVAIFAFINSDFITNQPVYLQVFIIFVPLFPDLVKLEIDDYKNSQGK